jgi:hypothetical protein
MDAMTGVRKSAQADIDALHEAVKECQAIGLTAMALDAHWQRNRIAPSRGEIDKLRGELTDLKAKAEEKSELASGAGAILGCLGVVVAFFSCAVVGAFTGFWKEDFEGARFLYIFIALAASFGFFWILGGRRKNTADAERLKKELALHSVSVGKRIASLEAEIAGLPATPCSDFLREIGIRLPPPDTYEESIGSACSGFVTRLARLRELLCECPKITSRHLEFADGARSADIPAAEALTKRVGKFRLTCQWCNAVLSVAPETCGKKARCPSCGVSVAVPAVRVEVTAASGPAGAEHRRADSAWHPDQTTEASAPGPFLQVTDRETNTQRRIPLAKPLFTIGKSPASDLALDKVAISRQHCEIVLANGTYSIRDLGSRNGTYVEGRRITASTPLSDGTRVDLGPVQVVFYAGEPQPTAAPAGAPGGGKKGVTQPLL